MRTRGSSWCHRNSLWSLEEDHGLAGPLTVAIRRGLLALTLRRLTPDRAAVVLPRAQEGLRRGPDAAISASAALYRFIVHWTRSRSGVPRYWAPSTRSLCTMVSDHSLIH